MPMWLDIAAKVATVGAVLIALSPHLRRAFRLLIYYPRESEKARDARIKLRFSGRMGWGQKLWVDFMHFCRTKEPDVLTWQEYRARWWWCPLLGHDLGERFRPADDFAGVCRNCHATLVTDTEDGLDSWAKSGRSPHFAKDVRVRRRKKRRSGLRGKKR